ncbi:MAG: gamma-glutamyl-gamma-aminobutyrate hydrolase family protein [Phycisphaeraceae bacterium]
MPEPVVGIVADNLNNTAESGRYEVGTGYSRCVAESGGVPVLLPHEPGLAQTYVRMCDGIILSGGVDPRTEAFGEPTHPKARPVDPQRQAFDLALLQAVDQHPAMPVLGVCLGMQMMALHAGGKLDQYLPETHPNADVHFNHHQHAIELCVRDSVLTETHGLESVGFEGNETLTVVSHHQQAVAAPGRMRIVARAPDGVIEAIDDPARRFYLGVQWHPERGGDGPLNRGLLARFVDACRAAT